MSLYQPTSTSIQPAHWCPNHDISKGSSNICTFFLKFMMLQLFLHTNQWTKCQTFFPHHYVLATTVSISQSWQKLYFDYSLNDTRKQVLLHHCHHPILFRDMFLYINCANPKHNCSPQSFNGIVMKSLSKVIHRGGFSLKTLRF